MADGFEFPYPANQFEVAHVLAARGVDAVDLRIEGFQAEREVGGGQVGLALVIMDGIFTRAAPRAVLFGGSHQTAIRAQRLAVDPAGGRAGQKGDGAGDVLGRAQPFQWCHFGKAFYSLWRFAVQK